MILIESMIRQLVNIKNKDRSFYNSCYSKEKRVFIMVKGIDFLYFINGYR